MKIVQEIPYNGAEQRIKRLNLISLLEEVRSILKRTKVRIKEERHANSGGILRKLLDSEFEQQGSENGTTTETPDETPLEQKPAA